MTPPNRRNLSAAMNDAPFPAITSPKNPIIPGRGICDPHLHIFQGRAYLYASHDASRANADWVMQDWHVWSSDNLVDWHFESAFSPAETYIGATTRCWAVDAAERNGRYYLYFSNGDCDTGVAVADSPGGPFVDALGKPLLAQNLTGTHQYDPTVFVDDDESRTPYLIWGSYKGAGYQIARLNEDMVSLAESPRPIVIEGKFTQDDKSFLHKAGGRYYLSWASFYAVSADLHGPYRYVGNLGITHDHGSFFSWNGQWFFGFTVFDPTTFYRSTGLCYIHYRSSGEMVADPLIAEYGVGQYRAEWNRIMACWYLSADGMSKRENQWSQIEISVNADGATLHYPKIHGVPANARIAFFANSAAAGGAEIEIRQGHAEGPLLGVCLIPNTGTWGHWAYRVWTAPLSNSAGTLDLCLRIRGTAHGFPLLGGTPLVGVHGRPQGTPLPDRRQTGKLGGPAEAELLRLEYFRLLPGEA